MSQPSGKLLQGLLIFVSGTVFGAWGKALGTPGMILGSIFGALAGWVAARWLLRKLF